MKIFAVFFAISLLSVTSVHAENDSLKHLRGEAFTDPSEKVSMPENWIKRPVKYDPGIATADIVIALHQHLYPALLPAIINYDMEHGVKIHATKGTCGISAGKLTRKEIDSGGFCCAPGRTDRLPGLRFHSAGIAAVALLVHPDNPIDNITLEQARRIFMGKIHRWSELTSTDGVKGPNLPIQPVARLHCKLRPGHWRLLLENEDLFSQAVQEVGAIPDMISQVAGNPRAIGFESMWMVYLYRDRGNVKALRIDGYSPTNHSHLISGDYPLYRVFNFTTWVDKKVANPHARKLVDYLIQETGHIDGKYGIVPVSRLKEAGWKFSGDELTGEPD